VRSGNRGARARRLGLRARALDLGPRWASGMVHARSLRPRNKTRAVGMTQRFQLPVLGIRRSVSGDSGWDPLGRAWAQNCRSNSYGQGCTSQVENKVLCGKLWVLSAVVADDWGLGWSFGVAGRSADFAPEMPKSTGAFFRMHRDLAREGAYGKLGSVPSPVSCPVSPSQNGSGDC